MDIEIIKNDNTHIIDHNIKNVIFDKNKLIIKFLSGFYKPISVYDIKYYYIFNK